MRLLSGIERKHLLDAEQVYTALEATARELDARYAGSMSWKTVAGRRYLYRKIRGVAKTLGLEGEETRRAFTQFQAGREMLRVRRRSLDDQVRVHARIVRAMALGRMPLVTARLLRRLDRIGSLGHGLKVAGTNALYVYERMAGIRFDEDVTSTMDVDLLYDARGGLDLVSSGLAETGLIGLLRTIDPSFQPTEPGSFRAVDDKGFMVDLITPGSRNPATRAFRRTLGDDPHDLAAVEIAGLQWLENSPSVEAIVFDERGYPLRMVAPDPRAFVCHKLWVADRQDREPIKRHRDRAQARGVCAMLVEHLPEMRFDDPVLAALPLALREAGIRLAATMDRGGGTRIGDWR